MLSRTPRILCNTRKDPSQTNQGTSTDPVDQEALGRSLWLMESHHVHTAIYDIIHPFPGTWYLKSSARNQQLLNQVHKANQRQCTLSPASCLVPQPLNHITWHND